jgi:hypothetical protein
MFGSNVPDDAISEETICRLHRLARGEIWDAGKYKEQESDIVERLPSGDQQLRFRTVPAADVTTHMAALVADWNRCLADRWVHPLIGMACFNLDFLCIHPFRDGNGRVSRLLLLLQSYHLDFEVGRYISLERLIEQNKERYYETLAQSSRGWHEGKHDPWHYVNFILFILKTAYRELVEGVGEVKAPRGTKTEMVLAAIGRLPHEFTVAQLEQACPGVSREMIRRVLGREKGKNVECIGRGPGARWTRLAISKKGNVS